MPIPSLFTPATLFVVTGNVTVPAINEVRRLAITDPENAGLFAYFVPSNGLNGSDNPSQMFLSPRTILLRLSVDTAAGGEILGVVPPVVNCSYSIQFYGPYVDCEKANATQQASIERLRTQQTTPNGNITQVMNSYIAYVPDLSFPDQAELLDNRMQRPLNGSNELWLSFKRNGTGYYDDPFPTCPLTEYRVCRLYNASYDLTLEFAEGNQTIKGYPPTRGNDPITYPAVSLTETSNLVQHAYSAYMWAFTNQLIGQMGLFNDSSANRTTPAVYSEIDTEIGSTSLLGSADLNCFFVTNHFVNHGLNATFAANSTQRQKDIDLARDQPLDVLIPELSFNTTVGLMNSELLA